MYTGISSFSGLTLEIKVRGSESEVQAAVTFLRGVLRVQVEGYFYHSSDTHGWKIVQATFKRRVDFTDAPHVMANPARPLVILPQAASPRTVALIPHAPRRNSLPPSKLDTQEMPGVRIEETRKPHPHRPGAHRGKYDPLARGRRFQQMSEHR